MKRSMLCAAAACAFAVGAARADAILYNGPGFTGASLALPGDQPNLQGTGFYDTVSSIEIQSGTWRFCSQPEYRGDCEILGPGRYPTLPRSLNHRIESVQVVDRAPHVEPRRDAQRDPRRGPATAAIELYPAPDFRGPSARFDRDVWSLARRGFDDRVASVIVNEGRWELCTARGYEGVCRVVGPGEYRELGARMNEQVSSIRRVQ